MAPQSYDVHLTDGLQKPPTCNPVESVNFNARQCSDPVTHKTILDFVAKVDDEVHEVREELYWQSRKLPDALRDHYKIQLPNKVEADVNPKGHLHNPVYIYHDLQFRLDQDKIQKLLMGTALYGDPGLCIRELL